MSARTGGGRGVVSQGGGQPNVDRPGQGDGGVPKITKFVRKSFMHEPLVVGGGGKIMTA